MPLQNQYSQLQTNYIKTTMPILKNTGSITPICQMTDSLCMSSANPTSQQLDPGFQFVFRLSLSIFLVSYSHSQKVMWRETDNQRELAPPNVHSLTDPQTVPLQATMQCEDPQFQRSLYSLTLILFVTSSTLLKLIPMGITAQEFPKHEIKAGVKRRHIQVRQCVFNLVITWQPSRGLIAHSLPPLGIYNTYSPCSPPTMHSLRTRPQQAQPTGQVSRCNECKRIMQTTDWPYVIELGFQRAWTRD
jgi:hypothetical protein